MKNKVAIYTAIFGDKDDIKEPLEKIEGCDFICFTDNPNLKSKTFDVRIVRSTFKDPTRNARMYKILPHRYLSDYEYTIWIDGSVIVKKNKIIEIIASYLKEHDIATFMHPDRKCIYEEAEACIALKKDSSDIIKIQIENYKRTGYPEKNGLISSGIILRRNSSPEIVAINEQWWEQINKFSKRDQLSFNYVAWKNNLKYKVIPGNIYENYYFRIIKHKIRESVSDVYEIISLKNKKIEKLNQIILFKDKGMDALKRVIVETTKEIADLSGNITNKSKKINDLYAKIFDLEKRIKQKKKPDLSLNIRARFLKMKKVDKYYLKEIIKKAYRILNKEGFLVFFKYCYKYAFYGREYFKLKGKKTGNAPLKKIVIYTAIFGDKDQIREPVKIKKDCDLVCFTDNPNLKSNIFDVRVVKPISADPVRSAKIYKILAHRFFPEYEYSIWIDGNILIDVDQEYINKIIDIHLKKNDMAMFVHPERDCIYEEAGACIRLKKDDPKIINMQMQQYRLAGYPVKNGLTMNTVILRKNLSPAVIKINEDWWREITLFSRRDQLSFGYVAWKNNFKFKSMPGNIYKHENFKRYEHKFKKK